MHLQFSREALAKDWSLSFSYLDFVSTKPAGVRLGVAFQLKFFCTNGYFAGQGTEPSEEAVAYLADQLGIGRVSKTALYAVLQSTSAADS